MDAEAYNKESEDRLVYLRALITQEGAGITWQDDEPFIAAAQTVPIIAAFVCRHPMVNLSSSVLRLLSTREEMVCAQSLLSFLEESCGPWGATESEVDTR